MLEVSLVHLNIHSGASKQLPSVAGKRERMGSASNEPKILVIESVILCNLVYGCISSSSRDILA